MSDGEPDLAPLLRRAAAGDRAAADALLAATYRDLRTLARARLRRAARSTLLDTTGLVHEWYERFSRQHGLSLDGRAHFLAHAATVMRSIVVDHARRRSAARRGNGPAARAAVEAAGAAGAAGPAPEDEILRVHGALGELARVDARLARVVELRYFVGLTEPEIGSALGVTERTVRRDWEKARLWLAAAMG